MYGFVNQAIRDFIVEHHGETMWESIQSRADIETAHFVSDQVYDDRVTYCLVASIAQELDLSVDEVLEIFGNYWVSFVDDRGYGALLSANGRSFRDFLSNLDQFHSRLATAYPKFHPPDFHYTELDDGKIEMLYESERKGLAMMVAGILKGLATRYDTKIRMEIELMDCGARYLIEIVNEPALAS